MSHEEEQGARRSNLATIKAIYEAFGTGDVETILDTVTDDVGWAVDAEPVAPWYGSATAKDGVASFFADIASSAEVLDFAVEAWAPATTRSSHSSVSLFG